MSAGAYIRLISRRWLPILLCLIAGVAGAVTVTSSQPRSYRASSRLFVNIPAARGVQEALQGVQLSSQLLASFTRMATSRTAAERIAARLSPRQPTSSVEGHIEAAAQPETLLIDVSATDTDPVRARDLANAAAQTLTELIAEFDPRAEGAVAARIIDPAITPTTPVSPRPRVNLALGAAFGLIVGLGAALALEALDHSVRTVEQAEAAYGAPVLVTLPRDRHAHAGTHVTRSGANSQSREAYRSLRTSLRFLETAVPLKTLLVTSAGQGEGKTTVAANLAVAMAHSGDRVIVIDADLRRPSLASAFGVPSAPGLTSVVYGEVPVGDALVQTDAGVLVLPPGPLPENQAEVLGSQALAALIDRAAAMSDVVILDTPPVLPVTDAAVLAALVDGVVVVSRFGSADRRAAAEATRTLRAVGAPILGVVINAARQRGRAYYRTYAPTANSPRTRG